MDPKFGDLQSFNRQDQEKENTPGKNHTLTGTSHISWPHESFNCLLNMRGYLDLSWTVKPKLCGHQPPSTGPSTLLCSPSIFPSPIYLKGHSEISYPISRGYAFNPCFMKKIFNTQWECLQLLLFPPTNIPTCEPLLFSSPSARDVPPSFPRPVPLQTF